MSPSHTPYISAKVRDVLSNRYLIDDHLLKQACSTTLHRESSLS